MYSLYVNLTCGPSFIIIPVTPAEIDNRQNLWNSVSDNPISTECLQIGPFLC